MTARCELCGLSGFELIATEIREGPGRICQCTHCGLVIQDIAMDAEELATYYNEIYQKTNSLDSTREQSPREHFEDRLKTIDPIVGQLRAYLHPDLTVLELGSGTGELLYSIKPHVKSVTGIEIHKGFVEFMKGSLGIEAYAQDINDIDFGGRKYDLIVSIATLDHLINPFETLLKLKSLLTDDGLMYVEVPNRDEALNHYLPEPNLKAFNKFFWHKAHFYYFTADTLTKLMQKAGLSCELSCRHEYTLHNYLNWYFRGRPQGSFVDAVTGKGLFMGNSEFEAGMNDMFNEMNERFLRLMSVTNQGDTLCCAARKHDSKGNQ
ncbi:class I SAM-dependent methyltransferase [Candidatus Magnetominusculus xianensis]|uniref:Methyltransferase type 11 n=1 Tax=Candidatus Magnetominusculus xianensis TaxID=1748249 RepID=A0ABR5SH91_9BACT|nr:class I SAM-dependent methyltransferase [Candidatus Magnetominusculus xianensis]KWT91057.1 methyltransferase type 11 [Candidatus Magnetominusculus xianensis]MBF0403297.1 class I SAM-dependent methyltransferase [Nitrospirota bacterium]